MDISSEAWIKWRDEWTTRLTIPAIALSYFIPGVPRNLLLALVEAPYVEKAYHEFYDDCMALALRVPFHDIQGIHMADENQMRIKQSTLKRAVEAFEEAPDIDRSLASTVLESRRRQLKEGWHGYEHIAHFLRRVYSLISRSVIPDLRPYVEDPDKRIPILLGTFMVYMRLQSTNEFPELHAPMSTVGTMNSITGTIEHWVNRFSNDPNILDTHNRLETIASKIDDSFRKGIRDRYHAHAHFFYIFVQHAKFQFQRLAAPKPEDWWWYCEKGLALPYLLQY